MIWGDISSITVADILYVGLVYAGFEKARQNVAISENTQRFIDFYGVPPTTAEPFFRDLRDKYPDIRYKIVLMTMNWFRLYDLERVLSGRWGYNDLQFIRNTVKNYTKKIASLKDLKIVFGNFDPKDKFPFGIDTVHFITNEFRLDPSGEWYDFKSHSSGLKYELCLSVCCPSIVWLRGPFPASHHDITVFRGGKPEEDKASWDRDALYFKMEELLEEGQRGVGDSAYIGEPDKIIITDRYQSAELKQFLTRIKQREETPHSRLKSWNILANRFRHGSSTKNKMELHGDVVTSIVVITQYDYENGRPPFQ